VTADKMQASVIVRALTRKRTLGERGGAECPAVYLGIEVLKQKALQSLCRKDMHILRQLFGCVQAAARVRIVVAGRNDKMAVGQRCKLTAKQFCRFGRGITVIKQVAGNQHKVSGNLLDVIHNGSKRRTQLAAADLALVHTERGKGRVQMQVSHVYDPDGIFQNVRLLKI